MKKNSGFFVQETNSNKTEKSQEGSQNNQIFGHPAVYRSLVPP